MGFSKLNADGAVSRNGVDGSVVVVCRDDHGVYLGSSAIKFRCISDPATLEALACREAQALADDLLLWRILVASDCLWVVNDISRNAGGSYGAIIREIGARAVSFDVCHFKHEHRINNAEAHRLAKFTLSLDFGHHLWLGVPHDNVVRLISSRVGQTAHRALRSAP